MSNNQLLAADGLELSQSGRLPVHVSCDNDDGISTPAHGIPGEMTGLAAKLKTAGVAYATHLVGKWDAGFASPAQLPTSASKGFDSFLGYLGKVVGYFDGAAINDCQKVGDVDLWRDDGPADPAELADGEYIEFKFRDRALDIIAAHDASQPLLLLYSSHLPHYPTMVPEQFLARDVYGDDESQCAQSVDYVFPGFDDAFECRTILQSQVNLLDAIVGELVAALKAAALWQDTLLVLQSDNGGHIQLESGAGNNFPLRGGKETDFEGGIRAVTLVSGGDSELVLSALPARRRGEREAGLAHIADWYATLCALAGVDKHDAAAVAAGLPDVDGVDLGPLLRGADDDADYWPSDRELVISEHTLLRGDYKVMVGNHYYAVWGAAVWPDRETPPQAELKQTTLSCTRRPCLFNVAEDASETRDLAAAGEAEEALALELAARLEALSADFYSNDRVGVDSCPVDTEAYAESALEVRVGHGKDSTTQLGCGCWMALYNYGGVDGPYQDLAPADIHFDIDDLPAREELRLPTSPPIAWTYTKNQQADFSDNFEHAMDGSAQEPQEEQVDDFSDHFDHAQDGTGTGDSKQVLADAHAHADLAALMHDDEYMDVVYVALGALAVVLCTCVTRKAWQAMRRKRYDAVERSELVTYGTVDDL